VPNAFCLSESEKIVDFKTWKKEILAVESYEDTVSKTNNHYSRIVQSDPCRHAF
jgi:hypothetical protein